MSAFNFAGEIPVAWATIGICTRASFCEISGSYPLADVVTRSGVGLTPRACQYLTSSLVYFTSSAERGPRLVAPDSPAAPFSTNGSSPGCSAGLNVALEYGPRSSGRPWKTQLPRG